MNPIVFAALHGLIKGYALKGGKTGDPLHTVVLAPLREELTYRAPLANAAPSGFNDLASAVAFGLAHFDPVEPPGHRAFRVVDAGIGGLVYNAAMRDGGLGNAVIAHAMHNLMVGVGGKAARRAVIRRARIKKKQP